MLDRHSVLLEGITKEMLGIEIGPWHNPLVPKSQGYNSLSLDVFDGPELRARASADKYIPAECIARIEDVDLVGTVSQLGLLAERKGIVGKVDYVISSHNFEHTPDPIRFLQDCSKILKPGGILSMAVPDKRRCFDYFRPHSTAGEFLDAYYEKRLSPSSGQIFDHFSLIAVAGIDGEDRIAWTSPVQRDWVRTQEALPDSAFAIFNKDGSVVGNTYVDAHCWQFTPSSLRFLLTEIVRVGLLEMSIDLVAGPNFHEIYARLSNRPPKSNSTAERLELLRNIDKEQRDVEDAASVVVPQSNQPTAVISDLESEIFRMRTELAALRNSSSWKITAPLRAIKTKYSRSAS